MKTKQNLIKLILVLPILFSLEAWGAPFLTAPPQELTKKPWEISPSLKNKYESLKVPGWVDPLPPKFDEIQKTQSNFLDHIQKTAPLVRVPEITPQKFPKLPWFDLKNIPKTIKTNEEKKEKPLTPFVTGSFQVEGKIAVFKTTDPHLYYVVPNRWLVSMNGYIIEPSSEGHATNKLRFLLSPSYSWADALTEEIKKEDPLALFVPLPKKFVGFQLDVPEMMGEVENQLLPTDGMTIGDQIYMSLELTDSAIDVFKILNEAKVFLTGTVTYSYPYDETSNFQLVSDIWLNLE